jgi:hypothetical protein
MSHTRLRPGATGENTMSPEVTQAIIHLHNHDIGRVRSAYKNGWYILTADNGEKKRIAAGTANTVLANCGWPTRGKNALLWRYAR